MSIRVPAEWEKQEFILLVFPYPQSDWQHSIHEIRLAYANLIRTLLPYQRCVVLCQDQQALNTYLEPSQNLTSIVIDFNDTWIRDFGIIGAYENQKLKLYDFTFNAWGGKFDAQKDNRVNQKLQKTGLFDATPMETIDFVLEGGSIDSNGDGVILSTQNCIYNQNRNPQYSPEQIQKKLKTLLGARELIVLKHGGLEGDDTDSHIDTLARFIDPKTIAYVACHDTADTHHDALALMEQELKKTGFDLLPLPLPKAQFFQNHRLPATYLNFIFINNALIVPTYDDPQDAEVLGTLQGFFPNRDVIGVDARVFIREHGSLHCASMNYFCYNSNPTNS
ncbi:agmatine deiminase family protein [Sulfurospirillum sp. 1612]|uniref:agmatine deiminase family protein n=1 Tax=Sulfurospirillum sp. 1612 TaxID=3094835 RepID=UPI002F945B74